MTSAVWSCLHQPPRSSHGDTNQGMRLRHQTRGAKFPDKEPIEKGMRTAGPSCWLLALALHSRHCVPLPVCRLSGHRGRAVP